MPSLKGLEGHGVLELASYFISIFLIFNDKVVYYFVLLIFDQRLRSTLGVTKFKVLAIDQGERVIMLPAAHLNQS